MERTSNRILYRIQFISNDDDDDVAVRVFSLLNLDESNREKLLPTINELNEQYRFVKFVCDSDGDLNLEYDFPVNGSNPAESATEMVARFVNIINEVYPVFMRKLWS